MIKLNIFYLISKLIKKINIPAIKNSKIDKTSKICSGSHVVDSIIGRYTYAGNFCTIINTTIGNFCSIADNCIIGGSKHPIDWGSTSPVFHTGKNILKKKYSDHAFAVSEHTTIGNDVWIGNNCLIKSGIRIKDGAIIGMGSVVTKDIGEFEIWAGNPAKLLRKRFSDDQIEKIVKSKWWNFEDEKIKKISKNINDINNFISALEE